MRSLITWLFGLDPKSMGPDTELGMRYNQSLEGWQVFLLAVGVIAFAVWIYRRDGRDTASPIFRTFLGILRALLICIAIFILTEPVLVATRVETRRSSVLILVDDSFSMDLAFADAEENLRKKLQTAMGPAMLTLKDADGKAETVDAQKLETRHFKMLTRLDVVSAMLTSKRSNGKDFLDTLKERHDVKIYGMSRDLSSTTDEKKVFDPVHLISSNERGGETRIGDCLRKALHEMRGQPIGGVIVITDGRQNAGEDAVTAAQAYKTQRVPIFTIGIGDPSEPKDFEVTYQGPDMILPDDPTECTALIRYVGYTGIDHVKVEMKDGEKVIASQEVKLGKPGEKTPVSLSFKESKPGKYVYTIKIPEQPGELRADNNTTTYTFQVVDKKVKVLYVEGQDLPRYEYRYLKNALRRDHTTEVDVLLATGDNNWLWDGTDGKTPLETFPMNKKEINEYDVLIFGDVNPQIFTTPQMELVKTFVSEGGGFIMIAGERFAPGEYAQNEMLAQILPVIPQRAAYQTPEGGFQELFPIELTAEGRKLTWTRFDQDDATNREVWEKLPKLYWYFPVKRKMKTATTVAVHPFDKDEEGNKMPLIVTMPYGAGRTMYIGVDGLWRWRYGVGDRYHYRFYNQAIRYLSSAKRLGGQKRFYLGADRNVAAIGDKIVLTAIVKDENLKDLQNEKIIVRGKTPKGEDFTTELSLLHDRPGNYEGNFFPPAQGDYTVWLKDDNQPDVHQSEVSFKVEKPQLEFENPRMDEELLQNVAKAGGEGGEYVSIERATEIPPKIQPKEERVPRETPINLWDNWTMFALFTVLITLEWVLRKRGRMI